MLIGISAGTTILDVAVDGRAPVKALIREIQRDSLRPAEIIHLDLYEVRGDEEITLQVPVRLIGIPDGVRNFGGVLDHVLRELEIEVLPSNIPEHVDLDVTALTIGHSLFVRDLKVPKAQGPQRPRHADLHRGGAADRGGAGRGRGGRDGRAGAHPEAEGRGRGRDRTEGLTLRAIVGLGNPGPEYDETRHNAGFRLADHLAARWRLGPFAPRRAGAAGARAPGDGRPVRVLKPQTYMNRSGAALAPLRALPGFDPAADLLVLVDDVALPWAGFACAARARRAATTASRASRARSSGRTTPGSGSASGPCPPGSTDLADFVLARSSPRSGGRVDELLDPMAEAVECWLDDGIERAMSRFNRWKHTAERATRSTAPLSSC